MKKLLKTCLLGLCAFLGFSFCNADLVVSNTINLEQVFNNYEYTSNSDFMCIVLNSCSNYSGNPFHFIVSTDNLGQSIAYSLNIIGNQNLDITSGLGYCTDEGYFNIGSSVSCNITIKEYNIEKYKLFYNYSNGSFINIITGYINSDININFDTNEILGNYNNQFNDFDFSINNNNYILKSSVNQNYCTSNNLCPSCPNYKLYIADLSSGFNEYNINEDINLTYDSSDIDLYKSSNFSFEFGVNSNNRISKSSVDQSYCTSNNLCPSCSSCPSQYTSLECQSEYSLIPISSVNQFYCESNNLCPVCTPSTGDLIFSNVYINDILHPGRASVFVNIPDYIFWDYSVNDSEFNIYVGSGYDVDYIDSIVAINSYRPTTEDFTEVFVGGLTLIMPYVMIILFIVFVRKFIKRIFK